MDSSSSWHRIEPVDCIDKVKHKLINQAQTAFTITIEILGDNTQIDVHPYDTPLQIAYRYCKQKNWDLSFVEPLSKRIQVVIDAQIQACSTIQGGVLSQITNQKKDIAQEETSQQIEKSNFLTQSIKKLESTKLVSEPNTASFFQTSSIQNNTVEPQPEPQKQSPDENSLLISNQNEKVKKNLFEHDLFDNNDENTTENNDSKNNDNKTNTMQIQLHQDDDDDNQQLIVDTVGNFLGNDNLQPQTCSNSSKQFDPNSTGQLTEILLGNLNNTITNSNLTSYNNSNCNSVKNRNVCSCNSYIASNNQKKNSNIEQTNDVSRNNSNNKSNRMNKNTSKNINNKKSINKNINNSKSTSNKKNSIKQNNCNSNTNNNQRRGSTCYNQNPKDMVNSAQSCKLRSHSIDYSNQKNFTDIKRSLCSQSFYKHSQQQSRVQSNNNTFILEQGNYNFSPDPKEPKSILQEQNFNSHLNSNQNSNSKQYKGYKYLDKNCTFHPAIDDRSVRIAKRDKSISTYDKLYENGKIIRTKLLLAKRIREKNESEQYSFQPSLNRMSLMIAQEIKKRNYSTKKRIKSIDNQCTFTPKLLSRSLEISRGKPSLIERSFSKSKSKKSSNYVQLNNNQSYLNKTSGKIVENKKRKIFEHLFDILDGDKDGIISSEKVSIEGLQEKYIMMLIPLFQEMITLNVTINKSDFCDAAYKIYKDLTVTQKNQLLNFDKAHKIPSSTGITPNQSSKGKISKFSSLQLQQQQQSSCQNQSQNQDQDQSRQPQYLINVQSNQTQIEYKPLLSIPQDQNQPYFQSPTQQIHYLPQQQQSQQQLGQLFDGSANLFQNILKQKSIQQQLDQQQAFKQKLISKGAFR